MEKRIVYAYILTLALMTGLMVYFAQLHDEYPDNIEVLEEE